MTQYMNTALVRSPVNYGLCLSEAAWRKELKKLEVRNHDSHPFLHHTAGAATNKFTDGEGNTVIVVTMHPMTDADIIEIHGILLHEAVHIWRMICKYICERKPSHEFEAYGIQSIAVNLMESYREQTTPKETKPRKAVTPAQLPETLL